MSRDLTSSKNFRDCELWAEMGEIKPSPEARVIKTANDKADRYRSIKVGLLTPPFANDRDHLVDVVFHILIGFDKRNRVTNTLIKIARANT